MTLDPFYPIFDSSNWLERLVPQGIKLVQLRIKDKSETEIRAEIRKARKICEAHNCQLIVNDYWKLALDEGCDYIHLGQEDLDGADLSAIQKGGLKLGVSTHYEAEDRKSTRLNSSHVKISYAVFCLKK